MGRHLRHNTKSFRYQTYSTEVRFLEESFTYYIFIYVNQGPNSNTGVYRIRNILNGHSYIGSTTESFDKRWRLHRNSLRRSTHHSFKLQLAWKKYGESSFVFEVVEPVPTESCLVREQYYLDTEKPKYNVCKIAGSPRGRHVSREGRENRRLRMTGKNNPFYGKHHTEESLKKMSDAQVGRDYSYLLGDKNPIYSHPHTDDLRSIMSESSRSFWNSDAGMKLRHEKSRCMIGKPNPNRVLRGINHPRYNNTVHTFKNTVTNDTFTGTTCEFIKRYNLTGEAYYLAKGKYKKHKGWTLI